MMELRLAAETLKIPLIKKKFFNTTFIKNH